MWEIDIDAESPKAAAKEALKMQRDPDSTATFFSVFDLKGRSTEVDLEEDQK